MDEQGAQQAPNSDWLYHRLLVMQTLTRFEAAIEALRLKDAAQDTDLAVLKTKAASWGFFAGAIGTIVLNYILSHWKL